MKKLYRKYTKIKKQNLNMNVEQEQQNEQPDQNEAGPKETNIN